MEVNKSISYQRAKKKVEALKGLYGHIAVYFILNLIMILINANVFNSSEINFSNWEIYFTAIMWGIGLFWHIIFVLVLYNFKSNFLKGWEERKIKEYLDKEN